MTHKDANGWRCGPLLGRGELLRLADLRAIAVGIARQPRQAIEIDRRLFPSPDAAAAFAAP